MAGIVEKTKKQLQSRSVKAGLPPGSVVFVGERKMDQACVDVIHYTEGELSEQHNVSLEQWGDLIQGGGVTWINVNGIHNVELIENLGTSFHLHPLTREDIVNTFQRPKAEEFPGYIYIVLKMISFDEVARRLDIEHVSMVLGANYVISFQEKSGDVFGAVRQRLQLAKGRIRTMKADYLVYSLMDAVIDHYFQAAEAVGDRIEELDSRILSNPGAERLPELHQLKRDILRLRKAAWPLREEIGALVKSEATLIQPETRVFLRDLHDHTIQIIDILETFRDTLGSMHDTFLSLLSNRMNEVMRLLTIIGTIFIPLTFIAGIYGMNFKHMPELEWQHGYPIVMGSMLILAVGMLIYFRKRKWL